jgi:Ion channel
MVPGTLRHRMSSTDPNDDADDARPPRPLVGPGAPTLRDRVRAPEAYGILLVLIIASLVAFALAGGTRCCGAIAVLLQGGVLLFALWTSRVDRRVFRGAIVIVPIAVAIIAILDGVESDLAAVVTGMASAVLAVAAIVAIVRRIAAHATVTGRSIFGALAIYLLIGMFYESIYFVSGAWSGRPFFVGVEDARSIDYLYFSFVTLTTTGYGDFTARADLGRMLAVTEALIGQLYLVSVVALVIGNVGRVRRRRIED